MTPEAFRSWRRSLGLKQREAAERLGLRRRVVQYYEGGTRDGKPVEIPRTVRLACWALSHGIADFDGDTAVPVRENRWEDPDASPGTAGTLRGRNVDGR